MKMLETLLMLGKCYVFWSSKTIRDNVMVDPGTILEVECSTRPHAMAFSHSLGRLRS